MVGRDGRRDSRYSRYQDKRTRTAYANPLWKLGQAPTLASPHRIPWPHPGLGLSQCIPASAGQQRAHARQLQQVGLQQRHVLLTQVPVQWALRLAQAAKGLSRQKILCSTSRQGHKHITITWVSPAPCARPAVGPRASSLAASPVATPSVATSTRAPTTRAPQGSISWPRGPGGAPCAVGIISAPWGLGRARRASPILLLLLLLLLLGSALPLSLPLPLALALARACAVLTVGMEEGAKCIPRVVWVPWLTPGPEVKARGESGWAQAGSQVTHVSPWRSRWARTSTLALALPLPLALALALSLGPIGSAQQDHEVDTSVIEGFSTPVHHDHKRRQVLLTLPGPDRGQ